MKSRYFLQLVGLSALWGGNFLFTRMAAPQLGPSLTACIRVFLGTLTLALIMRHLKLRWPWEHWRELLLLGAVAVAGPHWMYSWSSLYLPAGYSAVLNISSVLFGTFASAYLKEDSLTWPRILGCAVAFAGARHSERAKPDPRPVRRRVGHLCREEHHAVLHLQAQH